MPEELRPEYLALRAHCAGKPRAVGKQRLRETLFTVRGRAFAFMNSPADPAVTVKARRRDIRPLLANPAVKRARYLGCFGWITVSVYDQATLALAIELIDRSYMLVGSPRSR